ncbi:cytochrome c [Massilia sp. Se16.2.3]|uniref:c-type cytochrome n=1 Tax=Massilia sp. Se16.2.3 TaxID=2709303 RepID=UPI001600B9B1|nr:cytochrome c [Massilia sp. Se16.2.3]QNA99492.1 c-type cytochrome [Massilia sp. Se16.2.3]
MKRRALLVLAAAALLAALVIALAWPREEFIASASPADHAPTSVNIARGAYLARAGDCMACHTARGGAPYAGGRVLDTPFGRLHAPNITPESTTGIGKWSADDFWRALHNGKSRDGRLLYPAFPYTNYTKVTRADSDALFSYLRSLPPVRQPNTPHDLRFPYNQQITLAGWRLLYFKPGVQQSDGRQGAAWNRGAYLVEGLGHCSACHSTRNRLGATGNTLGGGLIPMLGWYAPSLTSNAEAGLGGRSVEHIVQLLGTGVAPGAGVTGPMAEVVQQSLQHMTGADLRAMALYLKSLPAEKNPAPPAYTPAPQAVLQAGAELYRQHCASCHGARGEGKGPYPALAGNRALTLAEPVNAIRVILNGGFPPGTAGNPRPYGMPPFSHTPDDTEVATLVTYLRTSWGNAAAPVSSAEVNRYRSVPLD